MWKDIVSQLEQRGWLGDALPIRCHRHPEHVERVYEAGQFPQISPDGASTSLTKGSFI